MINVYDHLVPEDLQERIFQMIEKGKFSPTQNAFPGSDILRMAMDVDTNHPDIKLLTEIIFAHIFEPEQYDFQRVYVNANTLADAPLSHIDSRNDQDLTVLYYANLHWNIDYGGETVFFNQEHEIYKAVIPVPGRLTVFRATIPHCARIQNRLGPTFRYTMAFKLCRKLNT